MTGSHELITAWLLVLAALTGAQPHSSDNARQKAGLSSSTEELMPEDLMAELGKVKNKFFGSFSGLYRREQVIQKECE